MDTKALGRVEIKDADQGSVTAVFATLGVVDSDGDVTVDGAFEDGGQVRISAYGHQSWMGALPVGKGTIRVVGKEALLDGQFFMDTTAGRDTFTVVKELGPMQQWSYGYDAAEFSFGEQDGQRVRFLQKQIVHEVSPVLLGSGINTRTLSAKSASKAAIRPHQTGVDAGSWDAAAVTSGIPADSSAADLRSVFAWVDPEGDPASKSSYKFPHHRGVGGKANMRACLAGIAALNGGRGGSSLSDADRKGVYNHLAAHLRDGDREPPELSSGPDGALKFSDEGAAVMAAVTGFITRATEVMALRAEKGKSLSPGSLELIEWLDDDLHRLQALLAEPATEVVEPPAEVVESAGLSDDHYRTLMAGLARVRGI